MIERESPCCSGEFVLHCLTMSAKSELAVRGMNCGNCARHVTEALQAVSGVTSATVTLETERATVRWQDADGEFGFR